MDLGQHISIKKYKGQYFSVLENKEVGLVVAFEELPVKLDGFFPR